MKTKWPAALAVVMLAAGCSGGPKAGSVTSSIAGTPSTAVAATPAPTAAPQRERQAVAPGVTVRAADGTLPIGFAFTDEASPVAMATDGVAATGRTVKLSAPGSSGTFVVTFDVGPPPSAPSVPVIAYTDGKSWSYAETTWSDGAPVAEATVSHFSWWSAAWAGLDKVLVQPMSHLIGGADTSALECDGTVPPGWSVGVEDGGDDDFSVCPDLDGSVLTVQIKNRRQSSYMLNMEPGWEGSLPILPELSALLGKGLGAGFGQNVLVIPPGEVGTVVISGVVGTGNRVAVPLNQDLIAWALDTAIAAFALLSGYELGTAWKALAAGPDMISSLLTCINRSDKLAQALDARENVEAIKALAMTAWRCGKILVKPETLAGSVLAAAGFTISTFWSVWSLLEFTADVLTGQSNRTLVIQSARPRCADATISAELGTSATVKEGLCENGWAYVDLCSSAADCFGDAQAVVRAVNGRWKIYTRFPSPICRSQVLADGAPASIVNRINWVCNAPPSSCLALLFQRGASVGLKGGTTCATAQSVLVAYDKADKAGSAAAARLSGGWSCSSPSAGERATIDYDTGCSNTDGRSFTAVQT